MPVVTWWLRQHVEATKLGDRRKTMLFAPVATMALVTLAQAETF